MAEQKNYFKEFKDYQKTYVYDSYYKIMRIPKDYEKITKKKMLEEIYKKYSKHYDEILSILNYNELKYLKLVYNKNKEYKNNKYYLERKNLKDKFIIFDDYINNELIIPEDLLPLVAQIFKNNEWKKYENYCDLIEFLIGFCKMFGITTIGILKEAVKTLTSLKEEDLMDIIYFNNLFIYNVGIYENEELIYKDYIEMTYELEDERKRYELIGAKEINPLPIINMQRYGFDIENKSIKKLLDTMSNKDWYELMFLKELDEARVLNRDREFILERFLLVLTFGKKHIPAIEKIKILNDALDNMPSPVLYGQTPLDYNNYMKNLSNEKKEIIKQKNACLSPKDKLLFYELYFSVLEFTNKKYKVNNLVKIYKQLHLNPELLAPIIDVFWKNKDKIIIEYCLTNPHKFDPAKIAMVKEFKKGKSSIFIMVKHEKEFTAVMDDKKTYMIKGLNCNLDEIIKSDKLPTPILMSIMPFKNDIVYDGILRELGIDAGLSFKQMTLKEYKTSMKYYHM